MQVKNDPMTVLDSNKALEAFLLNAHLYTPEQRNKIVDMLEYLIMPRYVISGKAPIEEEWIKKSKD